MLSVAPPTLITKINKLRWWMFSKKQCQSETLPPTRDALAHAISRAHFQAIVWFNDTTPNPDIPSPQDYGWKLEEAKWVPVMSTQLPAPQSVIPFVKCNCPKSRCKTARCTDMCGCSSDEDNCENPCNSTHEDKDDEDDEDNEDDDTDEHDNDDENDELFV